MVYRYTAEQIKEIVALLIKHDVYRGYVLLMFINTKNNKNKDLVRSTCENDHEIYHRMSWFRWTKYGGVYPNKEIRRKMRMVRDVMFKIPQHRLPLYINDPIAGPIVTWRLQNNL